MKAQDVQKQLDAERLEHIAQIGELNKECHTQLQKGFPEPGKGFPDPDNMYMKDLYKVNRSSSYSVLLFLP